MQMITGIGGKSIDHRIAVAGIGKAKSHRGDAEKKQKKAILPPIFADKR